MILHYMLKIMKNPLIRKNPNTYTLRIINIPWGQGRFHEVIVRRQCLMHDIVPSVL